MESILSHSQSQLEPQQVLGQPQCNLKGGTEYWLVCSALSQVYKSHCLGISLYQSDASSLKSLITFICLPGGWLIADTQLAESDGLHLAVKMLKHYNVCLNYCSPFVAGP